MAGVGIVVRVGKGYYEPVPVRFERLGVSGNDGIGDRPPKSSPNHWKGNTLTGPNSPLKIGRRSTSTGCSYLPP